MKCPVLADSYPGSSAISQSWDVAERLSRTIPATWRPCHCILLACPPNSIPTRSRTISTCSRSVRRPHHKAILNTLFTVYVSFSKARVWNTISCTCQRHFTQEENPRRVKPAGSMAHAYPRAASQAPGTYRPALRLWLALHGSPRRTVAGPGF